MLYSLDTTPEGLHPLVSSSLCGNMASTCSCAHIIHTHNAHTHTHTWMHPCRHWAHVWLWVHICTLQWPFWQQTRHLLLFFPTPCTPSLSTTLLWPFSFLILFLCICSVELQEASLFSEEGERFTKQRGHQSLSLQTSFFSPLPLYNNSLKI